MVPIGVLTRKRVAYLDVTLRSLSLTQLPDDAVVTVFDDASDDKKTLQYLQTNKPVDVATSWPTNKNWREKWGLEIINKTCVKPMGIAGKVAIQRLGRKPQGVVLGSCEAVRRLFAMDPLAPGVFLLQDDVLFNADWITRMQSVVLTGKFSQPLGLLSGIKLNHRFKGLPTEWPLTRASGVTAQCLYISRELFDAVDLFHKPQTAKTRFDDMLRNAAARSGFWAGVILPFVCQHFGLQSLVRPGRKWHYRATGRVGFYSKPPYVLARQVRQFQCLDHV